MRTTDVAYNIHRTISNWLGPNSKTSQNAVHIIGSRECALAFSSYIEITVASPNIEPAFFVNLQMCGWSLAVEQSMRA